MKTIAQAEKCGATKDGHVDGPTCKFQANRFGVNRARSGICENCPIKGQPSQSDSGNGEKRVSSSNSPARRNLQVPAFIELDRRFDRVISQATANLVRAGVATPPSGERSPARLKTGPTRSLTTEKQEVSPDDTCRFRMGGLRSRLVCRSFNKDASRMQGGICVGDCAYKGPSGATR